jgi:hypothetical protein
VQPSASCESIDRPSARRRCQINVSKSYHQPRDRKSRLTKRCLRASRDHLRGSLAPLFCLVPREAPRQNREHHTMRKPTPPLRSRRRERSSAIRHAYALRHGAPSRTSLRLLDADADNADWTEVARIVLHIDPTNEPARARRAWESHLHRAKWMTEHGYKHLLRAANIN